MPYCHQMATADLKPLRNAVQDYLKPALWSLLQTDQMGCYDEGIAMNAQA